MSDLALEKAAEVCENRKDWRTAFGYWSELISKYSNTVSSQQIEYREMHKKDCAKKMK